MFSLVGCWDVNSSVLTFVLVGFGGNLVQGFRVYPWTTVPSFPQIVLWFSLFLMFSLAGCWDVNSPVLTFILVGFGGNLAQGFKVYPWTAMQSFYVFRCFLERGARMLTCQCWLLYLWDLGETWHRVSRCIPEQLCKVSPKSHCDFLCFWCFLRFGADMLTCQCWLL